MRTALPQHVRRVPPCAAIPTDSLEIAVHDVGDAVRHFQNSLELPEQVLLRLVRHGVEPFTHGVEILQVTAESFEQGRTNR